MPTPPLRSLLSGLLCLTLLGLTGCESTRSGVQTRLQERLRGPAPVVRTLEAPSADVFAAVQTTLTQLGFRLTRTGAAQGVIEGYSEVSSDDRLRGSSQSRVGVRLTPTLDGTGTSVAIVFTELVEADYQRGPGLATETPLRDSPLYTVFFRELEATVASRLPQDPAPAAPAPK